MPGGNGPSVVLQTPSSPLVRSALAERRTGCSSPLLRVTFSALGAYRRKVTLPSACTSGETTTGRLGCACPFGAVARLTRVTAIRGTILRIMSMLSGGGCVGHGDDQTFSGTTNGARYGRRSKALAS